MESYYQFRFRRFKRRTLGRLKLAWILIRRFCKAYIFSRTPNLRQARRFMFGWFGLVAIAISLLMTQFGALKSHYLVSEPAQGGTYIEGVTGDFGPLNPLLTNTQASNVASALIFNGLFKDDGKGVIQPDLARSWQVNSDGTEYTVELKTNQYWQDGQPLTASDVAFTVGLIQDPTVDSALANSWHNVTVSVPNSQTVVFHLPSPYTPFLNLLTVGLLPKHILSNTPSAELHSANFNQLPIGSGPFAVDHYSIDKKALFLRANRYFVNGPAKLNRFVIRTYSDYNALASALSGGDINAAGGFGPDQIASFTSIKSAMLNSWPLDSETLAFFNTQHALLSDVAVRQALVSAINPKSVVHSLNSDVSVAVEPLLPNQLGFDASLAQLPFDLSTAKTLLQNDGWLVGTDGVRAKNGQILQLALVSQNSGIYPTLAKLLQNQWQAIGIKVTLDLEDLTQLQAGAIANRAYDILLQEIALGSDPDVYAFWDSSQAQAPGLNLSDYKSSVADAALEAGRTRLDPDVRVAKYHTFLKTWAADAPAVALFRPYYFYSARGVAGLNVVRLAEPLDRFWNVANWYVATQPELKRLVP